MKIVFVHQNFPGQFGRLARIFASEGHEVVALGTVPKCAIPGVAYYPYAPVPGPDPRRFENRFRARDSPCPARLRRREPGPRAGAAGLRARPRRGEHRLGREPVPQGRLAGRAARGLFRILLHGEGPGRGFRPGIPGPQRRDDLAAAGQERHAARGPRRRPTPPSRRPATSATPSRLTCGTGSTSSTTGSRRRPWRPIRASQSASAPTRTPLDPERSGRHLRDPQHRADARLPRGAAKPARPARPRSRPAGGRASAAPRT